MVTNVPNLSSRNCLVSILALEELLLEEARLLLRLAGGGLVLGVVDASREGRLLGRIDARAFGFDVATDKAGFRRGIFLVATIFFSKGALEGTADEGVL